MVLFGISFDRIEMDSQTSDPKLGGSCVCSSSIDSQGPILRCHQVAVPFEGAIEACDHVDEISGLYRH